MTSNLNEITALLAEGKDITIATLRPDGAPQATTVSYASEGATIYFGCAQDSQKARNLAHDPRVSATVNLPYRDWSQIRGVSIYGKARRVTDADELGRASLLFLGKFPEVAQSVASPGDVAMFRIVPEVVSLLDYRKGFGHCELVRGAELAAGSGARSAAAA